MAHMPLASLDHAPKSALVICFGMGTTHRSVLSWGIRSTAVELLPSVPSVYGYFHSNGPALLRLPNSRLVIDDGRMFLEKSREQYDAIIIDPPPPIFAAGVSLLYSQEFYDLAKKRLAPGGILQQWVFGGDETDVAAITQAVTRSFPYVRAYGPIASAGPGEGIHFIASLSPIPDRSAAELAARLPAAAAQDFIEWGPGSTAEVQFQMLLDRRLSLEELSALEPHIGPLRDDKPVNEYRYLRSRAPADVREAMFSLAAHLQ
jgi:spermidine synthase